MPIVLPSSYQNPLVRTADMTQQMVDLASVVSQINAGSSPILPVTLDVMNTVASVAVPSTPTILNPPTIVTMQNIQYDPLTGIVTILKGGNYNVDVLLNVFPTAVTTYFYGLEVDTGSGFVSVPTSGRQVGRNININGQLSFVSNSFLTTGLRARIYAWASVGTSTYQTVSTTALPGGACQVVAQRIQVTGV